MAKKYKVMLIAITIVLIGSIFLGTSYSLWQASKTQEGVNEISVGCFNITYTNLDSYGGNEAGDINLVNAYPISDEAGSALTPYVFKIKNTCTIAANYAINLETLNTSNFNTDYLKVKFNNVNNVTNNNAVIYGNMEDSSILLTGQSTQAKQLLTGYLSANEEATFSLRVWIDINATTTTPNVMGATWNGKVVVSSEAAKDNAVATIKKLVVDADSSSTDVIGDTGLAYDGTADNNLRYVGANPNNYVQFNNELWRIIGVMNNIETEDGEKQSLIKLIRNESLGNYSWDTSSSEVNNGHGINQWGESGSYEGADLMRELNNDYLGNVVVGTDGNWYSNNNNIKSATKPTSTISSEAQNQIESVIWNLGSANNDNGIFINYDTGLLNSSYVYVHERNNLSAKICPIEINCNDLIERINMWNGKIGLIYPSDYLYSTSGGLAANRNVCMNTSIYTWNDESISDCKNNNWMLDQNVNYWLLTPRTTNASANIVFRVETSGKISDSYSNTSLGVYPSLYLKSSVQITGGTGAQTDPYTLG